MALKFVVFGVCSENLVFTLKLKKVKILFVFYLDFKKRKMLLLGLHFDSEFDVIAGFALMFLNLCNFLFLIFLFN